MGLKLFSLCGASEPLFLVMDRGAHGSCIGKWFREVLPQKEAQAWAGFPWEAGKEPGITCSSILLIPEGSRASTSIKTIQQLQTVQEKSVSGRKGKDSPPEDSQNNETCCILLGEAQAKGPGFLVTRALHVHS